MSGTERTPGWAVARRLVLMLLAALVWGALLGCVWEAVWTPPNGAAYQGTWYLGPGGLGQDVGGTAWFAVIGLAGGLVYGIVSAALTKDREVLTLVAVVTGAVLASWVMFHVGHALGPADPQALAADAGDYEAIPSDLGLAGAGDRPWPFWFDSSAFTAFPAGALLGLTGVFLGGPRRTRERPRTESGS
ncbi:hypothetical protein [Nocardioides houyundeii]|uniref:hypothetical protein n=1 Tax=Nocardioides houyundeii TaxID=2045452 RepID=UPI0013B3B14F|nr:hypothetical protein [Nocardioides houyundeii]